MMIGIIGAMQTEVELLISEIKDAKCENISGMDFFCGKLCGKDVVVARCGIGKVFAAMCAQTMIVRYNVECLTQAQLDRYRLQNTVQKRPQRDSYSLYFH